MRPFGHYGFKREALEHNDKSHIAPTRNASKKKMVEDLVWKVLRMILFLVLSGLEWP